MYRRPQRPRTLIEAVAVYAVMTLAVVSIATFIIFFVMGFRFNADDGRIEQYAFLQFASSPSGATVTVDGKVVGSKTPNKDSVKPGVHNIVMWRDGYETWSKTVNLKAGTLTWLNYTLLIPAKLTVEPVATYQSAYASLASPDGHYMLIQPAANAPSYNLVDLSSDSIKTVKLAITKTDYSNSNTKGVSHTFQMIKWDDGGRYILIKHSYASQEEWLVLDSQDATLTKNITQLFNIPIADIDFAGTGGNTFYVLNQTDIRKLDLSAGTISKPLISHVTNFNTYQSNIITYTGTSATDVNKQVIGVYRDGENSPHVLRTVTDKKAILHVATTHYFNENYIIISNGNKVDVLSGSYPNSAAENATSMKVIASFASKQDIQNLSFSPTGEYVLAQSGADFTSYDLEYQTQVSSTIAGTGTASLLKWLDDNHIWTDRGGNLFVSEFDGTNGHQINPVTVDQDATLIHSGKYIYSINKSVKGYQLQRALMILP